jgi:polysaccharide biosynthesis protein VpsJ
MPLVFIYSICCNIKAQVMNRRENFSSIDYLQIEKFQSIGQVAFNRLEAAEFAGWDPFDALNSEFFNATPLRNNRVARLVWTQFFKRMPINLRRAAAVRKSVNAVTLSLASEIYRRQGHREKAKRLTAELLALRTAPTPTGSSGWGYPFPWQSKAFFVPRGAPNVIATAYAVRELAHWQNTSVEGVDVAIASAATLIAERFVRSSPVQSRYIAYVEESDAMVHNANLWGAFVLAVGAQVTGNHEWLELVDDAVSHTLSAQRPDGSWFYGEASHHRFIDGFHTGYVLEALQRISQILPDIHVRAAIDAGLSLYLGNFFETDGTSKYYDAQRYPIDGNPAAQAIITLDALGALPHHRGMATSIMNAAISNLWIEKKGYFAYQRTRKVFNKIEYPRWTQIWLALALSIMTFDEGP